MYMVVFLLIMAILIIFASNGKLSDFGKQKNTFLLKDLALLVKNEINVAYAMEPGYVRSFQLPETLEGKDYAIGLEGGFIYVSSGDNEISVSVQPVNGSLAKGWNTIRKVEGNVTLN